MKDNTEKIVKGFAILDGERMPMVGNGTQWQFPIFPDKREAEQYAREEHGFKEAKIVPCTITYQPS